MSTLIVEHQLPVIRRSGNYKPCIWTNDFVQSLTTDYTGERFNGRVDELKGKVIEMLNNVTKPLDQLELIDNLQRLGLGYHFEQEIKSTLKKIYEDQSNETLERKDLHAAALKFRLLRQHGYDISQDVFKSFMENGSFKGYHIFREQNVNVLQHLKKVWIDLVKCYLVEARWYHSGYKPTLEEYLENGKVSIALPSVTIQSYIWSANPIKKEVLEFLENMPDILQLSGTLCRIVDDYGTSSDELARGDVPKSIQCNMFHNYIYYNNDGFAGQDGRSKDMLFSLIVQPISL